MDRIEFNNNLRNYELIYWKAHRLEKDLRPAIMKKLFKDEVINGKVAADVGCGPHCGVFNELKFDKMFAIDPLWSEYKEERLSALVPGVVCIEDMAEYFKLPEKADAIFSFNALDHSGSLEDSFHNIMNNLSKNGRFYFHLHLRTKEQLNMGHRMIVTEDLIDDIISPYTILSKKLIDKCPLDNKPYKSYVAIVEN